MYAKLAGIVLGASLISGCASTNIIQVSDDVQAKFEIKNSTVLEEYFTPEARFELEKIPIVRGETPAGGHYASGRNWAVSIVDYLFLGLGFERKTVLGYSFISKRGLVHELVHHASALGLIDDSEFEDAWELMEKSKRYSKTCENIDASISRRDYSFWIDATLIWRDIERESELAEEFIFNGQLMPSYMQRVYRKVFRKYSLIE